jgi:hypothetical protein
MTDPTDHTTRLFAAQNMLGWTTFNENERAYQKMVRYLLDRVRALEAERATLLAGLLAVQAFSRNERVHEIIDAALPAPETVETQG